MELVGGREGRRAIQELPWGGREDHPWVPASTWVYTEGSTALTTAPWSVRLIRTGAQDSVMGENTEVFCTLQVICLVTLSHNYSLFSVYEQNNAYPFSTEIIWEEQGHTSHRWLSRSFLEQWKTHFHFSVNVVQMPLYETIPWYIMWWWQTDLQDEINGRGDNRLCLTYY